MRSAHVIVSSIVFSALVFPTALQASSVPAAEYCDTYLGISGLSGANVTSRGSECELRSESKGRVFAIRAEIHDFADDATGRAAKYAEYTNGAEALLGARETGDFPCSVKTEKSGSLSTTVITYNIPEEEDSFLGFNWGAGEITVSVDEYRDHVYSVSVTQSDTDGELDYPGAHGAAIAKTRAIIDSRIAHDSEDESGKESSSSEEEKTEEQEPEDGEDTLKVIAVNEDVEIRKQGGDWEEATTGLTLQEGDELSTGPDSTITLQFPDGTIVQVQPLSQIRVGFLLQEEDGIRAQVQLQLGKVSARVNPKKTSFTDFEVQSPIATASVRGTTFGAIYHSNSGMRVMVAEGEVSVSANDGTTQSVKGGSEVRVRAEGFSDQTPFDGILFVHDIPELSEGGASRSADNGQESGSNVLALLGAAVVLVIIVAFILRRKKV